MFGIASTFVGLSEGTAKYRFLALSSAIVAFSVVALHSRNSSQQFRASVAFSYSLFKVLRERDLLPPKLRRKARRPCCKAMTATKEFDNLDSIEEGEDAERELQEAERKHREEIEKLEKESS
ncbi:unnamed protein product [Brassica rapa]|uniref:Uncharacterized protein n=1 Tax=Brassica campestris TaxID=3711 RepID=A0A8D9HYQ4_BRACM|nr:unnamed protein product [Brassica rapa]